VRDHIFFSYAHEDSRFVMKLARDLRRQGLTVWLDQWDVPPELAWDKAIEQAVRTCACFLIILSPAAVDSWVVRDQFDLAARSGKPIVPVLYRPSDLPPPLQQFSVIDFSARSYWAGLRELLAHYFPEQNVQFEYRPKPAWGDLTWSWRQAMAPFLTTVAGFDSRAPAQRLLAVAGVPQPGSLTSANSAPVWLRKLVVLIWPGWLGPLLLSIVLIMLTYGFWSPARLEFRPPTATPARLGVINPATATPMALPTPIKIEVRVKDGKVMVYIPAGEFLLGSPENDPLADDDEKPQRPIFLDAFWIDKTEITNTQYQLCVSDGLCPPYRPQGRRFEDDHQPVVGVDWFQAVSYCEWSGGRLPTEAEWEKAARGVDGRIYPWGNEFDGSRLNSCDVNCIADWKNRRIDDGYGYTAPVGLFPAGASPYGVLDMSGNVWEWTADWYAADYYSLASSQNPPGPSSGEQRVVRGGSWYYYGTNLRVPNRHRDSPHYRYDNIGFRCVVDAEDQP
jgi:formylglycine-generating enzyme required for sulfatase activity